MAAKPEKLMAADTVLQVGSVCTCDNVWRPPIRPSEDKDPARNYLLRSLTDSAVPLSGVP
jgi:hypothetical protein